MQVGKNLFVVEGISGSGKTTQAKRLVETLMQEGVPVRFNTEPTVGNPEPIGTLIRLLIEGRSVTSALWERCIACVQALSAQVLAPQGASTETRRIHSKVTKILDDILQKFVAMMERPERGNILSELELQVLYMMDRRFDLQHTIIPGERSDAWEWVVQDRYEMSTFAYGGSRGLSIPELHELQLAICGDFYRVPWWTVYIRVDPEVAMRHLIGSGKVLDRFEQKQDSLARIDSEYMESIQFLDRVNQKSISSGSWHKVFVIDGMQDIDVVFSNVEKVFFAAMQ